MQHRRAMLSALHVVAFSELLFAGGSVNLRTSRHGGSEQFFAYDYSKHGQDWKAGQCSSRARQSPIDLPPALPVSGTFAYKYEPIVTPFEVMNNGHAFSADLGGLGYGGITYENAWYNLLNINVHSLSEHSWSGLQMPLEIHMVHKRYDGEALLIVAVPVESPLLTGAAMAAAAAAEALAQQQAMAQGLMPPASAFLELNTSSHSDSLRQAAKQVPGYGVATQATMDTPYAAGVAYVEPPALEPGFNPTLQAFLKVPPPPMNMKVQVPADSAHAFDLNLLLGGNTFYEYAGSLTAPPCAEIATWLVAKDSIKSSDKQLMYLHDATYKTTADFGNYRSLMPLNGRSITMRQGLLEDMPLTAAPPVPMPGKPQQSDREFRAMKWAMDAMTIARSATDYVKDLDGRLRNAAQAHANALAPQIEPLMVHGKVIEVGNAGQQALANAEAHVAGGVVAPGVAGVPAGQTPAEMQKTAETMARTLATAAREEIEDATEEISKRSKEVAKKAAYEAANMVMSGNGNLASLANGAAPGGMAVPPVVQAAPPPGMR